MISPKQFFLDFFPQAYVCAMAEGGGQFEGRLVDDDWKLPNALNIYLKLYQDLNKSRYNIYFTPNGGKTAEGKNSLSNLAKINSWWIDIDIEETKHADDDETLVRREYRKEEIRGHIFGWDNLPVWPSLTIETRNGYQLYWLADAEACESNWLTIGNSIFEHYKNIKVFKDVSFQGADKSTVKLMQLMRLPFFWYFKNGEQGKIKIDPLFSTLKKYSEKEMMMSFPPIASTAPDLSIKPTTWKTTFKPTTTTDDIFTYVINLPIDEVLQTLSGTWLVNGDMITLQKLDTQKSNVLVDGKPTPNFIDRATNHIYSNNAEVKGPTIIEYLLWYWPQKNKIAFGLKQFFTLSKT